MDSLKKALHQADSEADEILDEQSCSEYSFGSPEEIESWDEIRSGMRALETQVAQLYHLFRMFEASRDYEALPELEKAVRGLPPHDEPFHFGSKAGGYLIYRLHKELRRALRGLGTLTDRVEEYGNRMAEEAERLEREAAPK